MQKFSISIDLAKVDKHKLTKTEKGQIFGNFDFIVRDDVDQYGNIGFIVQKQSKEEREQQIKLPILGNAKRIEIKQQSPAPAPEHKSEFNPLPSEYKNDLPF
jgi:hypothetical protein